MAIDFDEQDGQTPLDPDEKDGLVPEHLSTQNALNAWEQENILAATKWLSRRRAAAVVLTEKFCRELHAKMFGKTWEWAGTFRRSDKNIGCDWTQVGMRLNQLLGNVQYWIDKQTFPPDEIAARFHRDLVAIHPFPNGNGRHSRMMADSLLKSLGEPPFTWGNAGNLVDASEARTAYLRALRAADKGDYSLLIEFVRS